MLISCNKPQGKLTGYILDKFWMNVNLEVVGSSPALVNFSLFIQNISKMYQSVSLVVYYMIFTEKSRIPGVSSYCLFPGCIVTWA